MLALLASPVAISLASKLFLSSLILRNRCIELSFFSKNQGREPLTRNISKYTIEIMSSLLELSRNLNPIHYFESSFSCSWRTSYCLWINQLSLFVYGFHLNSNTFSTGRNQSSISLKSLGPFEDGPQSGQEGVVHCLV